MDVTAQELPARPVVIFDGVCNLCNTSVQFILDHDRRGELLLCSAQSEPGQALLARFHVDTGPEPASVYLVENGQLHNRSTALIRIGRRMGFPWSLGVVLHVIPRFLRDALYKVVARNRYRWFGKREACRLPAPGEAERFLT